MTRSYKYLQLQSLTVFPSTCTPLTPASISGALEIGVKVKAKEVYFGFIFKLASSPLVSRDDDIVTEQFSASSFGSKARPASLNDIKKITTKIMASSAVRTPGSETRTSQYVLQASKGCCCCHLKKKIFQEERRQFQELMTIICTGVGARDAISSKNQESRNWNIEIMIWTGSVVVASSKVVVGALLVVVDSVEANLAASASSTS